MSGKTMPAKTMPVRSFFDTNILIYADDKASPAKQKRALALVAEHRTTLLSSPASSDIVRAALSLCARV